LKVIVDNISTITETLVSTDGQTTVPVALEIDFTLYFDGRMSRKGEITIPYEENKDMSIADHEEQLKYHIVTLVEESKGV
jgi:hypothetical protein